LIDQKLSIQLLGRSSEIARSPRETNREEEIRETTLVPGNLGVSLRRVRLASLWRKRFANRFRVQARNQGRQGAV
jgi:hypothetical protein